MARVLRVRGELPAPTLAPPRPNGHELDLGATTNAASEELLY